MKSETLQRTERLMMYICDAIDYSENVREALACLLGYDVQTLKEDADAFCNHIKNLQRG